MGLASIYRERVFWREINTLLEKIELASWQGEIEKDFLSGSVLVAIRLQICLWKNVNQICVVYVSAQYLAVMATGHFSW